MIRVLWNEKRPYKLLFVVDSVIGKSEMSFTEGDGGWGLGRGWELRDPG